jgi:hypothetical protein
MLDRGFRFPGMSLTHMPQDRNPEEPSSTYLQLSLKHKDATGLQKTGFETAYVAYWISDIIIQKCILIYLLEGLRRRGDIVRRTMNMK